MTVTISYLLIMLYYYTILYFVMSDSGMLNMKPTAHALLHILLYYYDVGYL